MRLKTEIAVSALLKRAELGGAFAAILRKGDQVAGAYVVTVRTGIGITLYTSERDMQGELIWIAAGPMGEGEASEFINRRVDFDPDLWVVEIEDQKGRSFLEGVSGGEANQKSSDARAAAEALFPGQSRRR